MRQFFCTISLAWAGLAAARAANPPPKLDSLLKGIEDHYNKVKTVQVDFVQTHTDRVRKTTEQGTLFLQRPGRMRWQYSSPAGKLWVCDGKIVFEYDPERKRVEKSKLKDEEDLRAPFAFLLGKLHFHDQFGSFDTNQEGPDTRIVAKPKSDKLLYTEVSFVAAPDFTIKRVTIKGQDGSVMDYVFQNEKRDLLLTDALFKFAPSGDVEVVDTTKVN
ncbi:MAG TPA: outer membrane lipoprotein chaperone LolA [Bryobacteraceae bacterium]|nr:outer membrane lipoprotein chaperone LolA [Bryobacteraceae bacterium]